MFDVRYWGLQPNGFSLCGHPIGLLATTDQTRTVAATGNTLASLAWGLPSLLAFCGLFLLAVTLLAPKHEKSQVRATALKYLCAFVLAFVFITAGQIFLRPESSTTSQPGRATNKPVDRNALIKVGEQVRTFRVRKLDGTEFQIAGHRGKVVVLNFFATWCGPCIAELPHLQKLWRAHQDDSDCEFLSIGVEESDERLHSFREKRKLSIPMAADQEGEVLPLFAKGGIPRTYLISPQGVVVHSAFGFALEDFAKFEAAFAMELAKVKQQ